MFKKENLRIGLLIFLIIALSSGCKKEEKGPIGPDLNPPRVISVESKDDLSVEVIFNEKVEKTTAEDSLNYTIDNLSIRWVALRSDQKTVHIATKHQDSLIYRLTVSNVKDLSENSMNSQTLSFSGWDLGIYVRAYLERGTGFYNYFEYAFVHLIENGIDVEDAHVNINGTQLFSTGGPFYYAGMIFESEKTYNLFIDIPSSKNITGFVQMTEPVEITKPVNGDSITLGYSLPVNWKYGGSPPESVTVTLAYDSPWYDFYDITFEGKKMSYSIPEYFINDSSTVFITVDAQNYGSLAGAKKGSYYKTSDSDQLVIFIQ
jgi:hypothetical protein